MKSIVRSILLFSIISLCGGTYASSSQIDLKVKGYHNENERTLESNSILFSGDSFQLSVEALDSVYVYAFLIDSTDNVILLNDNDSSFISKTQTVYFPSDTNNWFQLDENTGLETLIIASSSNKLNVSNISSPEGIDSLKENGAILETFIIKHMGVKLAMRGLDMEAIDDENLIGSLGSEPKAAESFESILNSQSSNQTILQIMDDAKGSELSLIHILTLPTTPYV